MDRNPRYVFILYAKNMRKSFLFGLLSMLLAGFWFGGISLATDYTWSLVSEFGGDPIATAKLILKVWGELDNWILQGDNIQCVDNICEILANTGKEVQLPEPLLSGKESCTFAGWYSNLDDLRKGWIGDTLKISYTTTLYAKWICNEWVAQIRNQSYDSFESAVNAVNTGGVRKDYNKIILLQDVNYTFDDPDKSFYLEKNEHELTLNPADWYLISVWQETAAYVQYKQIDPANVVMKRSNQFWHDEYLTSLSSTTFNSDWNYQLLKDVSVSLRFIPWTLVNNMTLDLNGHTITSSAGDAAFWFGRDWTESVHKIYSIIDTSENKWWKIIATWLDPNESTDALISIFGTYNNVTIWEWVVLEWWAITIFGNDNTLDIYWTVNWWDDFGIAANGADTTNAVINIHEWAEISSNQTAIYLPWKTNLTATIDGIVVWWKTAVEIRAGTLTIWEGAVLTSNWEFEAPAANWNGTTMNWVALAISQHTTNLPISVTINWWTFSWSKAVYEEDLQDEVATDDISISVSSGNFNWDVYSENVSGFINWWVFSPVAPSAAYIEDGYYAKEIDDDKYEITEIQEITSIDITWITTPVAWTTRTLDWIEITTTPEDAITIESEEWTVYPADNSSAYTMATGETFNTEDSYSFSIVYRLKTGYKLSNTTTYPENSQHDIQAGENPGYYIVIPYDDVTSWYTVKWKNWEDVLETDENVANWSHPSYDGARPTKAATSSYTYTFSWWSKDGTSVVNLATETITEDTTYSAIFTQKKKSWWGGGWSNWWSTTTNTGNNASTWNTVTTTWDSTSVNTWDNTSVNTWDTANVNTWDTTNITEENKDSEENKDADSNENLPEVANYDPNLPADKQILTDGLTPELHKAYNFAHENGITTTNSATEADMYWPLTRIAMAKMLSQYAINILWQKPDTTKTISFPDVSPELDAQYNNGVTLAYQLWIMWIWIDKFRPNDIVTRAEFVTALSRMLYWLADGQWVYYETHMQKLLDEKIITVADPNMKELRGYVMIMLMRSAENK